MTYVSRDPFARQELHKEREHGATCAWCGRVDESQPHPTPLDAPLYGRVYRFEIQSDGGRVFKDRQTFCSKQCRKDYHS